MIRFATYDQLHQLSKTTDPVSLLKEARTLLGKSVFLSHSSGDNDLLPGVIRVLEVNGGSVYVDQLDVDLPKSDFTETADRLRHVLSKCKKFVLLVTPRTKDSKWIPWELGLGDGGLRGKNVALFPSVENTQETRWAEREYLGLYQRIIWGNFAKKSQEWLVYDHSKNTAIRLSDWIIS